MIWDLEGIHDNFSTESALPWIPKSPKPSSTSFLDSISKMSDLRSETAAIYINTVNRNKRVQANCNIR